MNKEEFLKRAINRICNDYDYNFANELELIYINLQQENKELKEEINKYKDIRLELEIKCKNEYVVEKILELESGDSNE